MSTHRRGVRPSQWPVRDLLGPENGRTRFWDARVGAAAAGLLACGAAVTVVLTSGSRPVSDQTLETPGAPLALPAPVPVVPPPAGPVVPPPAAPPAAAAPQVAEPRLPARDVVAPRPRSPEPRHRRAAPRHRPAVPAPSPRDVPVERAAPQADRALAEQVATAVEGWEGRSGPDGAVVGWLLVPVQRPADAAALLDLARTDEPRHARSSGGRHRARDGDRGQRVERQQEDRGGRHRAPDGHGEDRGGRHRAPDHDDQRSTPYRFVKDDGARQDGSGQHEAGRSERGRAEARRADRDDRDRTVHDAAQDREERRVADRASNDDRPVTARSGDDRGFGGDCASGGDWGARDERGAGDEHASGDDVDWFSAA